MDKTKEKKRSYNHYNQDVIKSLIDIYGFGRDYIIKSIRGDRTGHFPEKIKKQYHQMANAAKEAQQKKVDQILKDE